jgi:hypothetical protein
VLFERDFVLHRRLKPPVGEKALDEGIHHHSLVESRRRAFESLTR